MKGRIHISQEVASRLTNAGKQSWFVPRSDTVVAKGKGEMKTYWLLARDEENRSILEGSNSGSESRGQDLLVLPGTLTASADQRERLIDWNVQTLSRMLVQIKASRCAVSKTRNFRIGQKEPQLEKRNGTILDEVCEVIELPTFQANSENVINNQGVDSVELSPSVTHQLKDYVTCIQSMYRNNPFHNFEVSSL